MSKAFVACNAKWIGNGEQPIRATMIAGVASDFGWKEATHLEAEQGLPQDPAVQGGERTQTGCASQEPAWSQSP